MVDIQSKSKVVLVPDTDERWERCRNGDIDARNSIVVECLPLVDQIVNKLKPRFPPHIETEELKAYGAMGLMAAVDTYDPERATFRTHAAFRIPNFIYDELRKQDWAPKTFRARAKEVDRMTATLTERLKRTPTDDEVGAAIDRDGEYVRQTRHEARASHHKSLTEVIDMPATSNRPTPLISRSASTESQHEVSTHLQAFSRWLDSLNEDQRVVWALRYYQELTVPDVAQTLDMDRADVSDMLRQITASFGTFLEELRRNN